MRVKNALNPKLASPPSLSTSPHTLFGTTTFVHLIPLVLSRKMDLKLKTQLVSILSLSAFRNHEPYLPLKNLQSPNEMHPLPPFYAPPPPPFCDHPHLTWHDMLRHDPLHRPWILSYLGLSPSFKRIYLKLIFYSLSFFFSLWDLHNLQMMSNLLDPIQTNNKEINNANYLKVSPRKILIHKLF